MRPRHPAMLICLMMCFAGLRLPAADSPHDGQIVRHSDHPQWLTRYNGEPIWFCGPGDPEGFLYLGSRRADGTRDGPQMDLIDKLATHGGNTIYMQIIRSHGGDGEADHNPFVDSDPSKGLDADILDQWESWFSAMDQAGILIYLFFYDDAGPDPFASQSAYPESQFYQEIVDRFEHHRHLIWLVAEEGNEGRSGSEIRAIAAEIDQHDDHGHLIGSHLRSNTDFTHWQDGSALNHYSMQYNVSATADVHAGAIIGRDLAEAAGSGGDGYQVIYSENTERRGNDTADIRAFIWEVAMGGVMPMRLGMDIAATPAEALAACRIQQQFFEATDFWTMANRDDLARGGTTWVLSDGVDSHIAYCNDTSADPGIAVQRDGSYDLLWLDVVTGTMTTQSDIALSVGDHSFPRPGDIGSTCAFWLHPTSGDPGDTTPPTITSGPTAATDPVTGTSVGLSVTADDDQGSTGLSYSWSADPAAGVSFSPAGDPSPTATFDQAGDYTIRVTVSDGSGNSTAGETPIQVIQSPTALQILD